MITSFETLGLRPELLRAVDESGYTQPTPIQPGRFLFYLNSVMCWVRRKRVPAKRLHLPCLCCINWICKRLVCRDWS